MSEQIQIVVAEDNPKDFEFLEMLLAEWDQHPVVERAPNGIDALALALKQEDPLVISDIQMPEMNGVEFARRLWEKSRRHEFCSGVNLKTKCMSAPC